MERMLELDFLACRHCDGPAKHTVPDRCQNLDATDSVACMGAYPEHGGLAKQQTSPLK